jgi:hypothetical protein
MGEHAFLGLEKVKKRGEKVAKVQFLQIELKML